MASLKYSNFSFSEQKPRPVTFEDVFRRYSSLAEIHKIEFDDQYGLGQQALWNTPTGIINQRDGYLYLETSGSPTDTTWRATAENLPQSYVVEQYMNVIDLDCPVQFDVSVGVQSFTDGLPDQGIKAELRFTQNASSPLGAGAQHGYISDAIVTIHAFGTSFPSMSGVSWVATKTIPTWELPSHGLVRCAFYQSQYDLNNLTEISVVLWYNDILLGYCICSGIPQTYIGDKMAFNYIGYNQGFARIGKLSEICPVSSADPGEAFEGAIQRAIQDKYIKYFSRGSGALRVTAPSVKYINDPSPAAIDVGTTRQYVISEQRAEKWENDDTHYLDRLDWIKTLDQSLAIDGSWYKYEKSNQLTIDYSQAISRVRMLGAFAWATAIDWWLVSVVGNRFAEVQNSAVFSAEATRTQAYLYLRRVREQIFRVQIVINGFPYLEPEDLALLPGINSLRSKQIGTGATITNSSLWWIDSVGWESVDGSSLQCTINFRLNGFVDFQE